MTKYDVMRKMTLAGTALSVVAMVIMIWFSASKTLVVAGEAESTAVREQGGASSRIELHFSEKNVSGDTVVIPLPQGIVGDDIALVNRYGDHLLLIKMRGSHAEHFAKAGELGGCARIEGGTVITGDESTDIELRLRELYELNYSLSGGNLTIKLADPRDMYKKIVVVDAEYSDDIVSPETEYRAGELTLDIARRVKKILESEEIFVALTRSEDARQDSEKCVAAVQEINCDMYINIKAGTDNSERTVNGCLACYSPDYFIPGLDSGTLAGLLETQLAEKLQIRDNGLFEAPESDRILGRLSVPAASVVVGYITDPGESAQLANSDYRESIAGALAEGIKKAYNIKEAFDREQAW